MSDDYSPPWSILPGWEIIGMNHYRNDKGKLRLYAAMVKRTRDGGRLWVKAEGEDDEYLWNRLRRQAQELEAQEDGAQTLEVCTTGADIGVRLTSSPWPGGRSS